MSNMSSKRYAFIVLFLILALVGLYFLKDKSKDIEETDNMTEFAIDHPEDVTLLFMTDQSGENQIYLKKQNDGTWTVNDNHIAWQKKVDFLIKETMVKIKVQGPAPKAAVENILSYMSINGIKVEVYKGGTENPDRVYIVGNTTPSQLGTYFKIPGDHSPMIIQIPGFNGFVNSRYSLKLDDWISRTVFGSVKSQIEEVMVSYPDSTKNFSMIQKEDGNIDFTASIDNVNNGAVKSYLSLFEKRNFETFINTTSDSLKKALLEKTPFCTIRVKSSNREIDELKFYTKKPHEKMHGLYDNEGNQFANDPSRFYALYNKLNRVLIVQDYTFGKVLLTAEDFKLRTN